MKNQNGASALLILAIISPIAIALAIPQLIAMKSGTDKQWQATRNRAMMMIIETQIKNLALNSTTYSGCNSAGGSETCRIRDAALFNRLMSIQTPGAICAEGIEHCGIRVQNFSFNHETRRVSGTIVYEGTEVSLHPIQLDILVPAEVLQARNYDCGAATQADPQGIRPIFMGFDSTTGQPICKGTAKCAVGQYIIGINPSTLDPICQNLPTLATCESAGQTHTKFISNLNWTGNPNITPTCVERLDPFVVFAPATTIGSTQ